MRCSKTKTKMKNVKKKNKEIVDLSIIEGKVAAGEDGGERRKRTSWTWRQKA